jgi:hypothetical protein
MTRIPQTPSVESKSPKNFEKDPDECGIRCSVCYIFVMMIKIGKLEQNLENPFLGIKSLKKWLIK